MSDDTNRLLASCVLAGLRQGEQAQAMILNSSDFRLVVSESDSVLSNSESCRISFSKKSTTTSFRENRTPRTRSAANATQKYAPESVHKWGWALAVDPGWDRSCEWAETAASAPGPVCDRHGTHRHSHVIDGGTCEGLACRPRNLSTLHLSSHVSNHEREPAWKCCPAGARKNRPRANLLLYS